MREDLNFPMLSDWDHEVIHEFGVVDPTIYDQYEAAQRSIFVLDEDGTVAFRWVEGGGETDFRVVVDAVREAVADVGAT